MKSTLEADRLRLCPLRLDDVDLAIEMFTDPEVTRYAVGLMTRSEIEIRMHDYVKRGGGGCIGIWCVTDRTTGEKLGTGALLPMPVDEDDTNWELLDGPDIPDGDIEIGYLLKRSAWGRGYATEICRRLLAFAFENTPLERVVACVDDDNAGSRHVLGKCGFVEEGRRLAYGEQSLCFYITRVMYRDRDG